MENEWTLEKNQELRFEVDSNSLVTVKVTSGTAEIFGTELAANVDYKFKIQNIAIFTDTGCIVKTKGASGAYIGKETPMNQYLNVHMALQNIRSHKVPRVLILGPLGCFIFN